jgi:hypothetical protein
MQRYTITDSDITALAEALIPHLAHSVAAEVRDELSAFVVTTVQE